MTGQGGSAGTATDESGADNSRVPVALHLPPERVLQHIEILKRSYLYLRVSLVGVVAAILLAIVFTPDEYKTGDPILRSISHYYYTPARIVFTGALCAAALALLVISGKGVQSYLLDLAALLAPLIAIIPTPTLKSEVGAAADLQACVAGWPTNKDCIPEDQLGYVAVGINVWFVGAAAVLAFALVLGLIRHRRTRDWGSRWYWIVLGAGIVTLIIYVVLWWSPWSEIEHQGLQQFGHIIAAGTFFVIIMVVAVLEAWRQWADEPRTEEAPPPFFTRKTYARWYGFIALVLLLDILAAILILLLGPPGNWVFLIEIIGLLAFAVFWAFQTAEHCRDADGWESPPPIPRRRRNPASSTGVPDAEVR